MAKNKFTLEVKGFEELISKLDELGGSDAMKRGVESALKESKQYINSQIKMAMANGNLPAGGKYSTGETLKSLDEAIEVVWQGMTAEMKIGFKLEKSGLRSIFLMYGTPKMPPVAGLKDAVYGNKTKKKCKEIQTEAINKVIKRIMEG